MSKKSKKKKKKKKVNPRKEKYAKFRKDKPATANVQTPDFTPEQMKQIYADEQKINRFLRFNRPHPTKGKGKKGGKPKKRKK
jgi:hypothetical protein